MNTITITKKEYNALVFAKGLPTHKISGKKKSDWNIGFGVFKNSFGKGSSVSIVKKMRKSWRA